MAGFLGPAWLWEAASLESACAAHNHHQVRLSYQRNRSWNGPGMFVTCHSTTINFDYPIKGIVLRMALACMSPALCDVLESIHHACLCVMMNELCEHGGSLQAVQSVWPQTWGETSVAAWVKGEVSCCSSISGRDCESPADPVQPEEVLLCSTDTGLHAHIREPVGMRGGTTDRHTACGGSPNTITCARQTCCMRQRQAKAGTCGRTTLLRVAALERSA